MNKTAIEWTDYTWNPVTGCWGPGGTAEKPNRCPYCYAAPLTNRFKRTFAPTFYPVRLDQPARVKKPSKIFVCSMADLFGDWVPTPWILRVLERVNDAKNSHHTFQFLTKNPKRLKDFNPWPDNCYVGTTVTNQADADERLHWLVQVQAPVLFVSHEPLLADIDLKPWVHFPCGQVIQWAIIGAMTGPGAVRPDPVWVLRLEQQYQEAGVPIFEKNNLRLPGDRQDVISAGARLFQEFPK